MRKLIMFNMITLDGFFEGPNKEIDWHTVDGEFNEFAVDQLNEAGGLIFGRKTYDLMASYWPTSAANADDPSVAAIMNEIPKMVFSRTMKSADWNNTSLINNGDEIKRLKQSNGKDYFIFGSADLCTSWSKAGLIDEYRIIVSPVVLGKGNPLFKGERIGLNLERSRQFANGNVLLVYEHVA